MQIKKDKQQNNLDFEISFYEELLQDNPDYVDALIQLGDSYTKKGFFQKGLEIDLKLSQLRPDDPIVFYNLACSYSLTGDIDLSKEALKRSLDLGYRDFEFILNDRDLKNLRNDSGFSELLKVYKK